VPPEVTTGLVEVVVGWIVVVDVGAAGAPGVVVAGAEVVGVLGGTVES
jgi:hypothetical protein